MTRRAVRGALSVVAFAAMALTGAGFPAVHAQEGGGAAAQPAAGARPVVVVETTRGRFAFELYAEDAPRSVQHILALVERGFYEGHRVHRVEADFVVQFGDPYSKDMERERQWGRGGSGKPIGVAEISPKYKHQVGTVALAFAGHPMLADSQIYIILADTERSRRLDGNYTIIGQVVEGMDVVQKIQRLDVIDRVYVR